MDRTLPRSSARVLESTLLTLFGFVFGSRFRRRRGPARSIRHPLDHPIAHQLLARPHRARIGVSHHARRVHGARAPSRPTPFFETPPRNATSAEPLKTRDARPPAVGPRPRPLVFWHIAREAHSRALQRTTESTVSRETASPDGGAFGQPALHPLMKAADLISTFLPAVPPRMGRGRPPLLLTTPVFLKPPRITRHWIANSDEHRAVTHWLSLDRAVPTAAVAPCCAEERAG